MEEFPTVFRAVPEVNMVAIEKFMKDLTNDYPEMASAARKNYSWPFEPLLLKRLADLTGNDAFHELMSKRGPDGDGKVRDWGFTPFASRKERFAPETLLERLNRYAQYKMLTGVAGGNGELDEAVRTEFREIEIGRHHAARFHEALSLVHANRLSSSDAEKRRWYVLKVELLGAPQVWRTVRVAGGTSLFTLADKVLIPAMGWTRQYHSAIFTETNASGAVFGLPYAEHRANEPSTPLSNVDCAFFAPAHAAYGIIDFRDVCLAQMLMLGGAKPTDGGGEGAENAGEPEPYRGQQFEFVNDLGLRWTHTVTLVDIEEDNGDDSAGKPVAVVLDGAWPCPPEDGHGLPVEKNAGILAAKFHKVPFGRAPLNLSMDSLMHSDNSGGEMFGRVTDGGNLWNYEKKRADENLLIKMHQQDSFSVAKKAAEKRMVPYNKDAFSVAEANQRVLDALGRRLMHAGRGGTDIRCTGKCCDECKEFVLRTGRDPRTLDLCCYCCRWREQLKSCGRCLSVKYCSAQCQLDHWNQQHKKECKRLVQVRKRLDDEAAEDKELLKPIPKFC